MESMYTNVTKDGKTEYTKDIEIINPQHDQLAAMASEFVEVDEADYYATYLKNTGMDLYKAELERESKHHKNRNRLKLHRVKRLMANLIKYILRGGNYER